MNEIIFAALLFLPAGISNMAPIFVKKIPIINTWSYPIDFYKSFRGVRVLGDHKTIRGFVSGVIFGAVIGYINYKLLLIHFKLNNFTIENYILFAIVISLGALVGDSVKSFFKRQFKIQSGKAWFPFDQIDYIVGGLLFGSIIFRFALLQLSAVFLIYFIGHLLACIIGYLLGLKDSWL